MDNIRRVVVIGAAGEVSRIAAERFALVASDTHDFALELYDIAPASLDALVRRLPPGLATAEALDLFDAPALRAAIDGAALVVLGAGPCIRTAEAVMEACLDLRVPYLDLDDDEASTRAALALDAKARAVGIPLFVGCGASPGFTNVMAADAARDMDFVERVDVCWVVGDEGPGPYRRAVLDHVIRAFAGSLHTWDGGRPVVHQAFVESDVYDLGSSLGDSYRLYECAHPESVTMPQRWPGADRIRFMGALHPAPINGIVRGIAVAVHGGRLSMDDAIDFTNDITVGKVGSVAVWRFALSGLVGSVWRGEMAPGEVVRFFAGVLGGRRADFRGTHYVRVTGLRDRERVVSIRRLPASGPGTAIESMASDTGSATAAFMLLALQVPGSIAGVLSPEGWVNPEDFYAAVARTAGVAPHQVVEAVVTPSSAITAGHGARGALR